MNRKEDILLSRLLCIFEIVVIVLFVTQLLPLLHRLVCWLSDAPLCAFPLGGWVWVSVKSTSEQRKECNLYPALKTHITEKAFISVGQTCTECTVCERYYMLPPRDMYKENGEVFHEVSFWWMGRIQLFGFLFIFTILRDSLCTINGMFNIYNLRSFDMWNYH